MSYNLQKADSIFIAGHRGLVGSAIYESLRKAGYTNLLVKTRQELDLSSSSQVDGFFESYKPKAVILAAAKVGGIHANNTYRSSFIHENLKIQNNVIGSAHRFDTKKFVFLGSSCVYPKEAEQPITEESLLSGHLEFTNRPYAIAKIAGLEFIDSIRREFKKDFFSVMPCNLYGPRDNFHPENSHVLPAFIRKIHEAKESRAKEIEMWGTGKPMREFLYSEDCADAVRFLLEKDVPDEMFPEGYSHINIGSPDEVSIKNLMEICIDVIGYEGQVIHNTDMPDGTFRKKMSTYRLDSLGWKPRTSLRKGIKNTYEWFLNNTGSFRES